MPGLPPTKELKSLIEQAMLEKAPSMHKELKASGSLDKVLTERVRQAQDSYETAITLANDSALSTSRNLPFQETASELVQARNEAARIALDQAVEFETEAEEATSERRLEA